jgi:hypothetical protein
MATKQEHTPFDFLYESVRSGNVLRFRYDGRLYEVFPIWSNCSMDGRFGEVIGCSIGECGTTRDDRVRLEELAEYLLDGERLCEVLATAELLEEGV